MKNDTITPPPLLSKAEYLEIVRNDDHRDKRRWNTRHVSWTILTSEVAKKLASFIGSRPTLDAGAGTEYTSYHLHNLGAANITASDAGGKYFSDYGMSNVYKRDHTGCSTELLPGDFEVVLLSWPPYLQDFGLRVARGMKSGTVLIYNGEGEGGCTGDDEFHDYLESCFIEDVRVTQSLNKDHVRWPGIYDEWRVLTKV